MVNKQTWCFADVHGNFRALKQIFERAPINKGDRIISLGDIADGWHEVVKCVDFLLSMQEDYEMIFIKGNHDCLDYETEVFTKRGWLRGHEIILTDEVIGINQNGLSEWQSINKIIKKESDHINIVDSQRVSMGVTDNHRILHKTLCGYEYLKFHDVNFKSQRLQIPLVSNTSIYKDYDISDAELKLIAWVLTDGSVDLKTRRLIIYQSKKDTSERIEKLLNILNINYSKNSRERDIKQICGRPLKNKPLTTHTFILEKEISEFYISKYVLVKDELPNWLYYLSFRQARLFINESMLADGTTYHNRSQCYIMYGTQKFLGYMQTLCSMHGLTCTLTEDSRNTYRLNINNSNYAGFGEGTKVDKVISKTNVWCLNVNLSNFFVRRNGTSYFTGNCWFMNYLVDGDKPKLWIDQGGKATFDNYTETGLITNEDHKNFFINQIDYFIDEKNRLFVHGGFDLTYGFDWSKTAGVGIKNATELQWNRDCAEYNDKSSGKIAKKFLDEFYEIYIGHTAHNGQLNPRGKHNIWNLDTGAGYRNKLTIINVDTKEFYQSDAATLLYPNRRGR